MTNTKLLEKNYSPLVVRKYIMKGWPMYVGVICDLDLSDLDDVVNKPRLKKNASIQDIRNYVGRVSDKVVTTYDKVKRNCVEGVAVLYYVDKMAVSSLYGDFMVHFPCKSEFYSILNMLPHV